MTRLINEFRRSAGQAVWQRNYYEHVIRSENDLARVRDYIDLNAIKWADDENHPDYL